PDHSMAGEHHLLHSLELLYSRINIWLIAGYPQTGILGTSNLEPSGLGILRISLLPIRNAGVLRTTWHGLEMLNPWNHLFEPAETSLGISNGALYIWLS